MGIHTTTTTTTARLLDLFFVFFVFPFLVFLAKHFSRLPRSPCARGPSASPGAVCSTTHSRRDVFCILLLSSTTTSTSSSHTRMEVYGGECGARYISSDAFLCYLSSGNPHPRCPSAGGLILTCGTSSSPYSSPSFLRSPPREERPNVTNKQLGNQKRRRRRRRPPQRSVRHERTASSLFADALFFPVVVVDGEYTAEDRTPAGEEASPHGRRKDDGGGCGGDGGGATHISTTHELPHAAESRFFITAESSHARRPTFLHLLLVFHIGTASKRRRRKGRTGERRRRKSTRRSRNRSNRVSLFSRFLPSTCTKCGALPIASFFHLYPL